MSNSPSTSFTDDRVEYETRQKAGESIVYAGALHLPLRVKPLSEELRKIAGAAETINVLNPFASYFKLQRCRRQWQARRTEVELQLQSCTQRMGEPVEGSSAIELGWIQGFTLAAGISAFAELNAASSSVSESLDRKAAYTMACFSLYVALISLVATLVLGILSLK
jgi:hypothetical protein